MQLINLQNNLQNKWIKPVLISALLCCSLSVFAADELAGILDAVKDNFGLKSVFVKMLYLMEIYYGWHKWRQTGNPWSAAGIVAVAMFFTYAIPKWVTA